jgi:type I restriction enzyme M protein
MRFDEFVECQEWWGGSNRDGRVETESAWRVPLSVIEADSYNLDRSNPNRSELKHRSPEDLIAELIADEREIVRLLDELHAEIST